MTRTYVRAGRWTVAACLLFMLLAVPALAAGDTVALQSLPGYTGEFAGLDGTDGTTPITLRSRILVGADGQLNKLDGLWLAGLGTEPDTPPTLLSVVWAQDTSGWFPTWGLQLRSDAGLFPAGAGAKTGSGFLADSSFVNLTVVTPEAGHVAEVLLSYDPATGRTDVGVTDITVNKRLAAKTFFLEPYDGPLYPVVGVEGQDQDIHVQQFVALPYGVPAGVPWNLMIEEEGEFKPLVLSRFTPGNDLGLRVGAAEETYGGRYMLTVNDGTTQTTLLELPAADRAEAAFMPFAAAELPLGKSSVEFNYVDEGGNVWTIGTSALHIVEANLHLNFRPATVDGDTLHGVVTMRSDDETLHNVPLRLYATVTKPGQDRDGVERQRVAELVVERISTESVDVPFAVQVQTDHRLYSLLLEPEFGTEVGLIVTGNEYYVVQ